MLCVCSEVTQQVVGDRRLKLLRQVAEAATDKLSVEATCAAVAEALEGAFDVPFATLRLRDGEELRLAAGVGLPAEGAAADRVNIAQAPAWIQAAASGRMTTFSDVQDYFPARGGPWGHAVTDGVAIPLTAAPGQPPLGVLTAGLNPNRELDEDYQTFFQLLAAQVATAVRNARVFEEERARAEALAELDRAKTQFFSNVSHEFRTPLTLMLGPLEDLLSLPPAELPARRTDLALVHRNAMRLLKLVNTLLDFSRVEAGRTSARFVPTDVAQVTEDLASTFRSAVERAGLAYRVEVAPPSEPLFLDRDMWEKVVLNLISNAFKHTFKGEISVRLRPLPGSVELTVADTGVGIPSDELPKIFDRFHRVEGAASRSHEGSGIGLALVKELVRLHGGEVAVESTPGQGTSFRVSIPTGSAHLPATQARADDRASTQIAAAAYVEEALHWSQDEVAPVGSDATPRARLLLADDNADMRAYVARLLGHQHEVILARDGEEAFRLALAEEPDLILTDIMMPKVDGFELLRRVRAEPALKRAPVIFLSARAGEEAKVQGLEAGADDYLVKPFSAAELLARVSVNLELARMRRAAAEAEHQAQKMEAIGQLTGGVAHDFNNLLMAITGSLDLALRRVEDDRVLRLLRNAAIAADRGATLTKQLLAFARRMPLAVRAVDANSLIARMSELLHRTLGGQVAVSTHLARNLPPVLADETQLELVLFNLAVNARDAMPGGGALVISTEALAPGAGPQELASERLVCVTVSDTGQGMSEDVLARAFEPFFTTKEVGKGTGLGLSQVYGVISALGGAIRIESAPGKGASVHLYLRVSDQAASHPPEQTDGEPLGARRLVLLVDDDHQVRATAAEMLRELGHEVVEAASGEEALQKVASGLSPDLLLVDYAMPGMNGAQVADRVRQMRPQVQVLFATGYASGAALSQERAQGMVVEKPFSLDALRRALSPEGAKL
ncbi:ATP-binding protein [Phenylobacterium deserti]